YYYVYKNHLIYINEKKKFSLTDHNMVNDQKKVLEKKCGYKEKFDFSYGVGVAALDILIELSGDSGRYHSQTYKALGKWINIHNKTFNIDS
ncbi:MAG: hypothetical protein K2F65_01500, partial [Eubacterium sp.]|nr:hypothetical protein [Eubacterium sp.]